MSNGNSTLPPIQPGDPSDIQRRIESLKSTPQGTGQDTGKIKLQRAPGAQFQNVPFSGLVDAPKIVGRQGWLYDITSPTVESTFTEPGVVSNIANIGTNVADPRIVGDQSRFLNENMKLWEGTGDRLRKSIIGGALQGINRLGEDFGGLLGGSLWGEDFERNAIERYFASSRDIYGTQTRIYDDYDNRFYQGVQGALASIVEFAPIGRAVTGTAGFVARNLPKAKAFFQGYKAADAGTKATIGATTRVSEQVAANGSKLSNWFMRNQNALTQLGTAVPAGIIQNRFEGTAMALQTREEVLDKLSPLVQSGDLTIEQAEKIANQEANSVRAMNQAMMLQDVFQHALLFRARGITRSGYQRPGFTWNPKQYLKNAFGSTKAAFNYGASNFIVQGIGEALEEGFQSGIQQDAIRNAQLSARDILEETGKDKDLIQVDNLAAATKSNVLARYLKYMGSDDAKFEMAIGFFAGAGQRMIQSYTNQAYDTYTYNSYSKKIEALKRDLPTDTPENRQYRQQKIQELEYKRALATEKGRAEAARALIQSLKTDTANAVKFSMETDDLVEAAQQNGLEWIAEGIKSKAFYQLFMRHAGNATVDHLERHLQDIAEGRVSSPIFPEDGSARTKAKELLNELTRLEKDFISLSGYRGANKIMNAQESARIDQQIVDNAFAQRAKNKESIIEDLRKLSKSKATNIELDLETGEVTMKDSLGREVKMSKSMQKAIEASTAFQDIFGEGGLNEQIDALQERVIETRASVSEMISKSGQAKLQREEEQLEEEIKKRKKLAKKGRRAKGGKTKADRDKNNVDNHAERVNSEKPTTVDNDVITGSSTLAPESNPQAVDPVEDDSAEDEFTSEVQEKWDSLFNNRNNTPTTPGGEAKSSDIKSDKEIQDAAEAAHVPNTEDNPVFGYNRGRTSNENKVASLQLEYQAKVENGVITLEDTNLNLIDSYLALSDATRIQEGDTVEFRVLTGQEADNEKVRDVSDLDQTKQGKVKTVKEARANSKNLAAHETKVSNTEITEAQIEEDTQPIQIVLKRKNADGTTSETIIGYVHTPLYEREARRENEADVIAADKKKLRDFRKEVLAGNIKGAKIGSIRPIRLNYISKAARRATKTGFEGLTEGPGGDYILAYSDSTGSLIVKGGSSIKSVNGIGRKGSIVNIGDVQEGMAYAVVPLKKDQNGQIMYYAAPLFTRTVTANNVSTMFAAVEGYINKNTALGGAFKSRLDNPDPSGLVRILKRFTRVRNTNNMLHKAGQSFIYTKTVPTATGTQDIVVFAKVLSEQEGGIAEVEIIQGQPLSNSDAAFVKQVLAEQYTNIDFDAVKEDKAFMSTINDEGKVTTTETGISEFTKNNTLASIEPVRTSDGKLPNNRIIFHVNPDVRFVTEVSGLQAAPDPDVKPDSAPDPTEDADQADQAEIDNIADLLEISPDTVKDNLEAAKAAAGEDEELNDFLDSFEDDEAPSGLLPQAATNRSEETRNRFNLTGLNPTQQEQAINNIVGDLLTELSLMQAADRLATPEQLFDEALDFAVSNLYAKLDSIQNKLEKALALKETEANRKGLQRVIALKESIKNQEAKLINLALTRFEQQAGVVKKTRKSRKPTEADKPTDRSKKIADAVLGLFTKSVSKESLAIDEDAEFDQDEESGEAAPGINKSYHSDNFYFTLDPIDTASSRLRQSLMTLVEVSSEGAIKKNFLGGNVYGDPYQVFKLLSTTLDGSKPDFGSQINTLIRKYLTDRGFRNAAPWLPSLVLNSATLESLEANELGKKFLEKAFPDEATRAEKIAALTSLELNPQILNEFASVMSKHALVAPMVSIFTSQDGTVYANVFSQNRNATTSVVKEEFARGTRSKLYTYDATSGTYVVNEEAFREAIDFLEELYQSQGKIPQEEFRLLMESKIGISLSSEAVEALFEDGIKLETSKNSRRVKMTDAGMWGNRSPFNIMKAHLNDILVKKIPYSTKGPTNFGAIDRIVKLEATRSTNKRYGTTFYSGGRNIATMTSNKYFSNLLDELFVEVEDNQNPEYVDKLVKEAHEMFSTVFESPSQLLTAILQGTITREDLEFQYLNFSPLKQEGESSEDFNKLKLREHTQVKNALFTASTNTQRTFTSESGFTFEQRQATITPLTFSDKDTVMVLKTLIPVMDFDATGQISNKTVSLFYDHVVMSEINRIIAFASNNADSDTNEDASGSGINNRELEEASSLFFLMPQLNDLTVTFRGEEMLLREALQLFPSENELSDLKPVINKELRNILVEMVEDKLQEFQEDPELYSAIPSAYKEFIKAKVPKASEETLMKMVAADITLGQSLGTANVIQVFAGDPALYGKIQKNSEGTIDTNATVKATYANIDKRLAALIAPGIEPSRESDEETYIQVMVPDIKMDYDSSLFEGLPDEFIKEFKQVEATDAQEFITYQEYLENAVRFGEISSATRDKVIALIEKEARGYVMTQEDKDLLKSVVFKAQKPVGVADYYTTFKGTKQKVRQRLYIKTSAVPLLPFFTRGTQLDNVRIAMEKLQEEKGLGVRLTFKTGTKVGFPAASKTAKLTNNDGTIKSSDELYSMFSNGNVEGKPYVEVKRKYWRIQQSVPTKTKDETTRGTQPDALIGSGVSTIPDIEPLVNKFNSNSDKLYKLRADALRNELMIDNPNTREGGKVIDREKLAILLEEVAKDRGFDFNVIEGLTIGEDGQFEIPAELSAASEQFQSMLLSIARKGIARKKVTGGSQVLMSEAMFRYQEGLKGKSDIVYTTEYDESVGLKPMRMEDGVVKPAQIIIPNKFKLPNGKIINFRKYIDSNGRIDLSKLPEGALEGFGFRIPTQGYNSMAAVEVVGFLPDYMGDIVIAPRSFMVQMGSDFDVDKLYDYFFKMEEKDGQLQKISGEDSEYGLQNALLQNRIDILKNPEVFKLIKTPLDFGLHKFKPGSNKYTNSADPALAEEINSAGGVAEAIALRKEEKSKTKSSILSEFYQRTKYLEARAALDAVGVKASLNSFNAVIASTKKTIELTNPVKFGKDIQVKIISGANTLKGSGRLKQDVISGSLSAAVDNQNEQIVNKYNLNDHTFDAHDAMELLGLEEDFIQAFLEQPILKYLVEAVNNGQFYNASFAASEMQLMLLNAIYKNKFPNATEVDGEALSKLADQIVLEFEDQTKDKSYDEVVSMLWNALEEEDFEFSYIILTKFQQFSGIMSDLRPVMRLISSDAKGAGSNISDFVSLSERADEILEDDYVKSSSMLSLLGDSKLVSLNDYKKIRSLEAKGYIKGPSTSKGYLMIKPDSAKGAASLHTFALSQELIMSEFSGIFDFVRNTTLKAFIRPSKDSKKIIEKAVRQYINSNPELFSGVTRQQLLYGSEVGPSLAQIIEVVKDSPALRNNALIQELEPFIEENAAHTLTFRNSAADDLVTDKHAKAFLDLLLGPNSNTVIPSINMTPNQVGRMLIDYAFLTGGVKTAVDFVRFVPTSYLIDLGFYAKVKEGFTALKTSTALKASFTQQLLQHNPEMAQARVKLDKNEGVFFDNKNSNVAEGNVQFSTSAKFKERAGITLGDNNIFEIDPTYLYISVKPNNRPRRVLKFNNLTGRYEMLDNLGTGTISEYSYGAGVAESVIADNRVSNYLGVNPDYDEDFEDNYYEDSDEDLEEETSEEERPTKIRREKRANPNDVLTGEEGYQEKWESLFSTPPSTSSPTPEPVETGTPTSETLDDEQEYELASEEDLKKWDELFGTSPTQSGPTIESTATEDSTPALAAYQSTLEANPNSTVSLEGEAINSVLEQVAQSDDMAHKYLAKEILDSDIIQKTGVKVVIKSGNVTDSSAVVGEARVFINSSTGNWEFEQAFLHELGHGLTLEAINLYQNPATRNNLSPEVRKALAKLNAIREQFFQNIMEADPSQIALFFAFTNASKSGNLEISSEDVNNYITKVNELIQAQDLKGLQEMLYKAYGATDLKEFVTLVMSSKTFRDMLDQEFKLDILGNPDKSFLSEILEVLMDIFRGVLNLEKRPISEYALQQTMVVMKNEPTLPSTKNVRTEPMIVNINKKPYTITPNNLVLDKGKKVTSQGTITQAEMKLAEKRKELGKVVIPDGTFYVFQGFEEIKVVKISPKGSIQLIKPSHKNYEAVIAQAFKGGDNNITGNETVTPTAPTAPVSTDAKAFDSEGNELELYGTEILRKEDGSTYEEFDTVEEAQKAFDELKQQSQQASATTSAQPTAIQQLREAESGEQGISEAEKATIKAAMDALLPPPDAFESREEYDQAEAQVKASQEYKDLERQLTGKPQPIQAPQPAVIQTSPKRSIINDNSFTYKGLNGETVTVETKFRLTEGQGLALEALTDFVLNPKKSENFADLSMTLEGPAGTGKTTVIGLVKAIVEKIPLGFLDKKTFIYSAPTHAATVEITSAIVEFGETRAATTIQSLGGMKVDPRYPEKGKQLHTYKKLMTLSGKSNVLIVDEASMLNKNDYEFLVELAKSPEDSYRIIFMGDSMQIPEVDTRNPEIKLVSAAFTDSPKITLTEVKRTSDNGILQLLQEMRTNITNRVPVIEGSTNVTYVRKAEGISRFIQKIKEDPENTAYVSYTKDSVAAMIKEVRRLLKYEGLLKPGEVITGYLGFQSKQISDRKSNVGDIANSVRYKVTDVRVYEDPNSYIVNIQAVSQRLKDIYDKGLTQGIPEGGKARTAYYPLSPSDAIALDKEPTKEQYEGNNAFISSILRELYQAKQDAIANPRLWPRFYEIEMSVKLGLAKRDLGNDYVYNPKTDRMELFNPNNPVHKTQKKNGFLVEKGIDYGYGINTHKAQGSTIKNVFFDANTIPAGGPTVVDKQGNRITTEPHALAYVGVSRASESLTVMGDSASKFYKFGEPAPIVGFKTRQQKSTPTQSPPIPPGWEDLFPSGIIPLQGTVEEFLKTLELPERRIFAEMVKNGEIKTICKLS